MRKIVVALILTGAGCAAEPDRSPTVPVEAFDEEVGAGESGELLQEKRIATH